MGGDSAAERRVDLGDRLRAARRRRRARADQRRRHRHRVGSAAPLLRRAPNAPTRWHNQLDYRPRAAPRRHAAALPPPVGHRRRRLDRAGRGVHEHTDFYLHSLGEYVPLVRRPRARYVGLDGDASVADLFAALELPDDARPGDAVTLRGLAARRCSGTLDWLTPRPRPAHRAAAVPRLRPRPVGRSLDDRAAPVRSCRRRRRARAGLARVADRRTRPRRWPDRCPSTPS